MNRAIFLDRDNTIIVDKGYLYNPNDIEFIPGVLSALRAFQNAGFLLIMVSNQSGIGRGYFTEDDYHAIHNRFVGMLQENGVTFAACYHCPHSPNDNCVCRKPNPHFAIKAAKEFNIDLTQSYMVGDKDSDIEFGNNLGAKSSFRSIQECAPKIMLEGLK